MSIKLFVIRQTIDDGNHIFFIFFAQLPALPILA